MIGQAPGWVGGWVGGLDPGGGAPESFYAVSIIKEQISILMSCFYFSEYFFCHLFFPFLLCFVLFCFCFSGSRSPLDFKALMLFIHQCNQNCAVVGEDFIISHN